jgi:ABC-2 type transport system ATP-binding protein
VLVSTHYMDEAERCHRLAYISYGKLLATGTAEEVIAHAALQTWELRGRACPRRWRCCSKTTLDGRALRHGGARERRAAPTCRPGWPRRPPAAPWQVTPIATGLEDVFIALTEDAQDNFA